MAARDDKAKCANQAAATTAGSSAKFGVGEDGTAMGCQVYTALDTSRLGMKAGFRFCFGFRQLMLFIAESAYSG
jgi:hypothetical protein